MATKISWSILSSKHPCYDADRIEHMRLLYKGGYDLKEQAKQFLQPMHQESGSAYQERLEVSAYRPYLTKFINIYKSNLFSVELTVHAAQDEQDESTLGDDTTQDEFYKQFLANCDGRGTSFHEFIKEKVYLTAEVCEYGYVGVDLPVATQSPKNLLQEKELGLDQAYLYNIDPCDVWDWEIDPNTGKFAWIKFGYRVIDRPTAFSPWMHHWKVCVFRMQDGVRVWETFETPQYDEDHDPEENDLLGITDSGETSFQEIGVFCLDLSDGQSLGYMLGPMVEEDYQMTSLENAYTTKACITIPWVKLRDNIGGLMADTKKARGVDPRGQFNAKGFIALNSGKDEGDEIGVVETTGTALKFLHLQSEDRKEQMHEIAHQLHSASKQTSSKTGRSAAAMKESRYQMEITLSDRASKVWKLSKDIFQCVSVSRKEDYVWAPKGLCTETPPDAQELQKALQNLSKYSIGSDLADKKIRFKLTTGILGKISAEEQEQVRREINEAVDRDDNVELYGPMFDAKLQQAINATVQTADPGTNNPTSAGEPGSDAITTPADKAATSNTKTDQPNAGQLPTGPQDVDPATMSDRNVSTAGVASAVMKQLEPDYSKDLLQWIPAAHWIQMRVPLDQIDDSNRANWDAVGRTAKIESMAEAMQQGWDKPIILVNEPDGNRLKLTDGHTRFLATESIGKSDINAYVAYVGGVDGPWKYMHDLQREGEEGGKSNQKSQQSNQKV